LNELIDKFYIIYNFRQFKCGSIRLPSFLNIIVFIE